MAEQALIAPVFGPNLSLLQSYPLFVFDTQGSAKPLPWAKLFYAFSVLTQFSALPALVLKERSGWRLSADRLPLVSEGN